MSKPRKQKSKQKPQEDHRKNSSERTNKQGGGRFHRKDFSLHEVDRTDEQSEPSESSKYRRREIFDNSEHIKEITEDNDETLPRGEDFEYLLKNSRGTDSHFKLKDEREWGDDEDFFDDADFLRIDCASLRAALDTIPLPKRLDIAPDVFLPEDLQNFETVASQKRATLRKIRSHPVTASADRKAANATLETKENSSGGDDLIPVDLEDELDHLLSLSNQTTPMDDPPSLGTAGCHSKSLEDLLNIALED